MDLPTLALGVVKAAFGALVGLLALVLVSGAGLLIRSFVGLMSVDPGFQRDRVLVAQGFAWDHNPTPAQLRTFFDSAIARPRSRAWMVRHRSG